jgi:hypothetical protein
MSKKSEYVAEVIHHEEEQLVSIIMDYKTTAKMKWLLGNVKWNDHIGTLYNQLDAVEVAKFLGRLEAELKDLEVIELPDMGEW